jgi:hypothetical protein
MNGVLCIISPDELVHLEAANSKLIDPILIGRPTGIVQYLWQVVRHPEPVETTSTGRWAAP